MYNYNYDTGISLEDALHDRQDGPAVLLVLRREVQVAILHGRFERLMGVEDLLDELLGHLKLELSYYIYENMKLLKMHA